jgi:hypothetical protein
MELNKIQIKDLKGKESGFITGKLQSIIQKNKGEKFSLVFLTNKKGQFSNRNKTIIITLNENRFSNLLSKSVEFLKNVEYGNKIKTPIDFIGLNFQIIESYNGDGEVRRQIVSLENLDKFNDTSYLNFKPYLQMLNYSNNDDIVYWYKNKSSVAKLKIDLENERLKEVKNEGSKKSNESEKLNELE